MINETPVHPSDSAQDAFFEALAGDQFLQVRYEYYKMLPDLYAQYYAFLVNKRRMRKKEARENGGWFRCTSKEVQRRFGIDHKKQAARFGKLRELGLISMEERGVPKQGRCRWFYINVEASYELMKKKCPELASTVSQIWDTNGGQVSVYRKSDNKEKNCYKRTKERGVSTKRPAPDGNGLGLAEGGDGSHVNGNGKSPEHPDVALARRFKRELEEKTILAPQWQPANQAREFSALRKSVGSENLERVFSWYCANLKNRRRFGAPTVRSPAQFRQQWGWILDCYEDANPAAAAPAIEISEDARRCAARLRDLRPWTEEQWQVLPHYIQQGFDDYGAVRDKIHQRLAHYDRTVRNAKKAGDQQAWNEALRRQTSYRSLFEAMPHPHAYILGWFSEWAELPKWNGDPAKAVWALDHWRFLKHAKGWSSQWDHLWKEANGHQE